MLTRRILPAIALLLLLAAATSCRKNEFKIEARFGTAGSARSLMLTYHASDPRKGWVVRFEAPVVDGSMQATGYTHDPTVVWVASAGGAEMTWFLANRGDEITIEGTPDKPMLWKIGGNEANRLLSEWRAANEGALHSAGTEAVNALIARFVAKNPDSEAAALLLLNTYDRSTDHAGFRKLWDSLGPGARRDAMVKASGVDPDELEIPKSEAIRRLSLFTSADTMRTFKAADAVATLLAFCHGDEPRRASTLATLRGMAAGTGARVIHISFARDTAQWHRSLPPAAERGAVVFAWAQGGPGSAELRSLNVPRAPWYMVLDRRGTASYSGPDSVKARVAMVKAGVKFTADK